MIASVSCKMEGVATGYGNRGILLKTRRRRAPWLLRLATEIAAAYLATIWKPQRRNTQIAK